MIRPESPLFHQMLRWAQTARRARGPAQAADAEKLLAFPAHYVDLVITAANIKKGTGAQTRKGTSGTSITAGQTVYEDASDSNKIKLADANASSATAALKGVALHAALADQPIEYQIGGQLNMGAILTAGLVYVVSANAGGIAPSADLAAGWRTSIVGVAKSTSVLDMDAMYNSDTALA